MSTKHITSFVSAGLMACAAHVSAQPTNQPNIVLILADDLGYGDLSCQGAKDIRTPNIDRIMNQGIRFTDFHANSTVSSPSRAALLTGRYPDLVGVPGVIRPEITSSWGHLAPDAILLPTVLKSVGYHSAIIGKWHLGHDAPNLPNDRGFDLYKGFLGGQMDFYTHVQRPGLQTMRHNREVIETQGTHATDLFTDWAIEYLNERKETGEPFFLYLPYTAPHIPLQPPQEWEEKVKTREPGISETRAKLVALIEHLDDGVGRVLATLEKNGMIDNTLIIFASDNGGHAPSEASMGIFRGAKTDMYEGGIRVACGMYWKDKIKAGTVTDNFAMLFDLFPTICEVAGATIPHPINAISILPTLLGQEQITDNRTVYWVYREGNMSNGGRASYATRQGYYKILQNTPWEPIQFFDLANDMVEQKPLDPTKEFQEIYRDLFRSQMEHIRQAGAVPWQKAN